MNHIGNFDKFRGLGRGVLIYGRKYFSLDSTERKEGFSRPLLWW